MIKVVPRGVHATQSPGNGIIPKSHGQARTHGLVIPQGWHSIFALLCIILCGFNMRIMRE